MDRRHLFVCGCPRSGTTATWNLLTASSEVVLGLERYGTRMFSTTAGLTPELFTYERFFDLRPQDTFYDDLDAFHAYYATARERFEDAAVIGDKLPKLYVRFERLGRAFPDAKVVFMFRNIFDVAASYKRRAADAADAQWRRSQGVSAAITDWTQSIAAFQAFESRLDMLPVVYEELFIEGRGLDRVCDFVGVTAPDPIVAHFRNLLARSSQLERARPRNLTALELQEICMRAPFGGYRKIVSASLQPAGLRTA